MHVIEWEKRLDKSDAITQNLITAIEGDPKRGIQGLAPLIKSAVEQVGIHADRIEKVEQWQTKEDVNRGTFSFRWTNVFTTILQVVGGLAVLGGIVKAATELIDWFNK